MPETVYVPIRRDRDTGEEFVHLEGASFSASEAEAAARAKSSGEWGRRHPLVRVGTFTLAEVRTEGSQPATLDSAPPVRRRPRSDGASEWGRGLDEEGRRG